MDIKHLHSTRFLPLKLVLVLSMALTGCAGTPEEPAEVDEPEVVEVLEPAAPVQRTESVAELKPNYPEKYVVVKGDTLWDISSRFLQDPWMWPRLWHFNPHISNPHLIYPGDILSIVFINGKPVLQVMRDGKVVGTQIPAEMAGKRYPTVKLSPRIRELPRSAAIPAISIDAIGPFLTRTRVVGENELDGAPYVMSHSEQRVMSGGGQKVYTRGLKADNLQGDYVVVRAGRPYRNPKDEDDILGYEAIYLGESRLTRFGDPSTMVITDSEREIMVGDRLIPKGEEAVLHSFTPREPNQQVDGQIISVVDGVEMIGQYRVVVLDLGRQDDMLPGDVLAVNQTGVQVRDSITGDEVTMPTEKAGTVMIFRVFDRVSYAIVMDATRTIHLYDQVTNP